MPCTMTLVWSEDPFGSRFCPSSVWVLGIELRWSGLVPFPTEPPHCPSFLFCTNQPVLPSFLPSSFTREGVICVPDQPTNLYAILNPWSSSLCLPRTEITDVGYQAQLHGTGNKTWGFGDARQVLSQRGYVFLVRLLA